VATTTHRCPACNTPLCRTNSWDSFDVSIGKMEDAMDAHLPTCGPSNTPQVRQAANAIADILRQAPTPTAAPADSRTPGKTSD
jgi:hypothetical protein